MNIETVQMRLKIAEMKQRMAYLDAEASNLITLIRLYISLIHDDITKIQIDEAARALGRLKEVIAEMKKIKNKLAAMDDQNE